MFHSIHPETHLAEIHERHDHLLADARRIRTMRSGRSKPPLRWSKRS